MEHAQEVTDSYFVSRYRTIYTWQELGIPGIRMFGKHTMTQACGPLSPHFHRNAYEITFVTEGAIHFTTQEKDYELSGSDVFMTRPNEVHSTNFRPLSAGEIIWFQLDISNPEQFLFLSRDAAEELTSLRICQSCRRMLLIEWSVDGHLSFNHYYQGPVPYDFEQYSAGLAILRRKLEF